MKTFFVPLLLWAVSVPSPGQPPQSSTETPACESLDACVVWFNARVPPKDDGGWGTLCTAGQQLLPKFGNAAKLRLLEHLNGEHAGWRNLASCILQKFPGLDEADVPALADGLRHHHGGWVANALGTIGSEDAIRALLEDLPYGSQSQTTFALSKLGTRALPGLLDYMAAHREKDFWQAQAAIKEMGAAAAPVVKDWQAIAINPSEPAARRIAALRGLEAIGTNAKDAGPAIALLLQDDAPDIRRAAKETLHAMRDPSVLEHLIAECPPPRIETDAWGYGNCLVEIAKFGELAEPIAPKIADHLHSASAYDRVYAAVALGMIGYQPAVPDLITGLDSDDWRMVLASARSLGWLKATSARAALEKTAHAHWFSAVRRVVANALHNLDSKEVVSKPAYEWQAFDEKNPFDFEMAPFRDLRTECEPGHWKWSIGESPNLADDEDPSGVARLAKETGVNGLSAFLEVPGGRLLGTDRGEWGGELYFQPTGGQPKEIYSGNIADVLETSDGIIALTGLAHMGINHGYVLSITPEGERYVAHRKLTLPGAPRYVQSAGPGQLLIVTVTGGYVLHSGWRLEEATCTKALAR